MKRAVKRADQNEERPLPEVREDDDLEGASSDNGVTQPPILFHSNAPWVGSGYGTQAGLFGPLIAGFGYRLAFSAFYGLKGARQVWTGPDGNPYVIYPGGRDAHGNDVLVAHAGHWFKEEHGLVILLTDPWVLREEIVARLPVLAWCPVDHDPLMPRTDSWFAGSGSIPVAMSRFGQGMMEEAGLKNVQYVPHGFDPAIFGAIDRSAARKALGIPQDAFVVGMCAANQGVPSRKCFSQALTAFSILQKKYDDAVLYLHTNLEYPGGENLPLLCDTLGIRPLSPDQYGLVLGNPATVVAATLAAFDVLLNPAQGEGFGVPLIEAMAVGTPCITTNFSSMPEVAPVSEGNWTVDGQPVWTPFDSFQVTPSIDEIVAALVEAHDEPEESRLMRRIGVHEWAYNEYQAADIATEHWAPILPWALDDFKWRSKRAHRLSSA